MKAIINTNLILEEGILWNAVLLFEGDKIVDFGEVMDIEISSNAEIIDAKGNYTAPGFVDIHNHGGNGVWFHDDPEKACRYFLSHGETTILPTLYTSLDMEGFLNAIDKIRDAKGHGAGRVIKGLYMEGPYMNPNYGSDAKNNKWKGEIKPEQYEKLVNHAGDIVKVWCIAPEREGIEGFVKYAAKKNPGVVFSMAHTEAKPSQAYCLKKYGLRSHTHHTNATGVSSPLAGIRDVGPDEACLYDSDMYAELICDSQAIHVKPHMLKLVVKIKGLDRVILVADSTPFDGAPPMGLEHITDLSFDSQGNVAGSRLSLDMACHNMMKHTSCGLCEVFRFAAINPAKLVGLFDEVGSIEKGKKANLLIIDSTVDVKNVIFEGEFVKQ